MHINCNILKRKCIKDSYVIMSGTNFAEFPPLSNFFCVPFLIDLSTFYRESSYFLKAFSVPVIFGCSRALMGLQQPNVGKRGASCSPQWFMAWAELSCIREIMSSFFEWLMPGRYRLLVGIRFLIVMCSIKSILPRTDSYHSTKKIRSQIWNGKILAWYFLLLNTLFNSTIPF